MLALIASIGLLTQQSAQTWLISAGYVVVGSILFLLHASFSTWDERLHVDTDEAAARHLASGAVTSGARKSSRYRNAP